MLEMESAACDFEAVVAGKNGSGGETPLDIRQRAPGDHRERDAMTRQRLLDRLQHRRNQLRFGRPVDKRTERAVKVRRKQNASGPLQDRIDFCKESQTQLQRATPATEWLSASAGT